MDAPVDDRRAVFEEKILALLDELLGAALRLAKNQDDAEDLVAETVSRAWAGRDSLKDLERFRPWLFRILTNCFLSECRTRAASKQAAMTLDDTAAGEPPFSLFDKLHRPFLLWWGTPEKEFLNKLLREDIERAIDTLPEAYRVGIVLSELEGFSYQDMARILAVPVGTIRSRLSRGRTLLQKALWDHAKEAGLVRSSGRHDP